MHERRLRAVYRGGVFQPLEPVDDIPEGAEAEVLVRIEEPRREAPRPLPAPAGRSAPEMAEALAGEELRRALEELIDHAAEQLAERIKKDRRLFELYAAVEAMEPGAAAARIGPPPLDNDTWLLILSDVLTVLEKAGLFEETRPLRIAANQRMLIPYDYVLSLLRGDTRPLERLAEKTGAPREIVEVVFRAMAEAVEKAVHIALQGRG